MYGFVSELANCVGPVKHNAWQCFRFAKLLNEIDKPAFILPQFVAACRLKNNPAAYEGESGRTGCLQKVINVHGVDLLWQMFWNRIRTLRINRIQLKKLPEVCPNIVHFHLIADPPWPRRTSGRVNHFKAQSVEKTNGFESRSPNHWRKIEGNRRETVSTGKNPPEIRMVFTPHYRLRMSIQL